MSRAQEGFLLLTSHLGDPDRQVLTTAQFRTLTNRVRAMEKPREDRELEEKDLLALGYGQTMARRILDLLEDRQQLSWYLGKAGRSGCSCLTRLSAGYPEQLLSKLGPEAPGCIWAKGDLSILQSPMVSLVGSRELRQENRRFAEAVGKEAARQGYVLVSGNARGADRAAQNACLGAGGRVVSVAADSLTDKEPDINILWLSEDSFDSDFSAPRALSRNRVIHCLGSLTFAAQSDLSQGGTWDGTVRNLRSRWSPVYLFADGSPAMGELEALGGTLIGLSELGDFRSLTPSQLYLEEFL